jgi:hypothetical protein
MDWSGRTEQVLFRLAVDEHAVDLGSAEHAGECLLTNRGFYLRSESGPTFSVALADVVEVQTDEASVRVRQRTGHLIDFAGRSVSWDGWHWPVRCADEAEAALLAARIRAAATWAIAPRPSLRRWPWAKRA